MNIPIGIINLAIKNASRAKYKYKHAAVIFNKKRVISTGFNQIRSLKYFNPKSRKYISTVHAEVDSIIKAKCNLNGYDILIIRLHKNKLLMSLPCEYCLYYINYVGIKNIYYSNNDLIYKL